MNSLLLITYQNTGFSIEAAFDNWIARTKEYTPKSFRDYVLSKNIKGLKCEVL